VSWICQRLEGRHVDVAGFGWALLVGRFDFWSTFIISPKKHFFITEYLTWDGGIFNGSIDLECFFLKGGAVREVAVVVFSREGGHDEPVDFSGCVPNIL